MPSGFLPELAKWKRAEKGTSTLLVEGLRMSRCGQMTDMTDVT